MFHFKKNQGTTPWHGRCFFYHCGCGFGIRNEHNTMYLTVMTASFTIIVISRIRSPFTKKTNFATHQHLPSTVSYFLNGPAFVLSWTAHFYSGNKLYTWTKQQPASRLWPQRQHIYINMYHVCPTRSTDYRNSKKKKHTIQWSRLAASELKGLDYPVLGLWSSPTKIG